MAERTPTRKKKAPAKKAPAKTRTAKADAPARPSMVGRVVPVLLAVVTVGVGVGLAAIPVGNWMDQRSELDEARERRADLQTEIAEIEADIENLVGEEGLEIAARCYGPFVEVGKEVYAVPGLNGCVTHPTSDRP